MAGSTNSRPLRVFLPCAPGVEPFLANEVKELVRGKDRRELLGGVELSVSELEFFRLALHCTLALGLWLRVAKFRARHFSEFETGCRSICKVSHIDPQRPVQLRVSSSRSRLFHTQAIAERFFNTTKLIAASEATQSTSEVQMVHLRIHRDTVSVSVDLVGGLLCKRGWRLETGRAPLRKDLASMLLRASGWQTKMPLLDPMCGSGTLPILAARETLGLAANAMREFAFEHLSQWDPSEFQRLRAESGRATEHAQAAAWICGGDRHEGAIEISKRNAARAGVVDAVQWVQRDLESWSRAEVPEGAFIVCNPPYGQRVGRKDAVHKHMNALGKVIQSLGAENRCAIIAPRGPWLDTMPFILHEWVATDFGGVKVSVYSGQERPSFVHEDQQA